MSADQKTNLRFATNGIHLNAMLLGEGPTIVFCHGFPGHWSNWESQLRAVAAAGYRGIALDMRGYGRSSRPPTVAAHNMDEQVADLCGLLDALALNEAIFVGQDFGAALVWNMALREAARVTAVVAISVPFDHDYYGRSCLGHLPQEDAATIEPDQLLVASPIHPPSHGFAAIAKHQFLHAHYFQQETIPDLELGYNAREFLCRIYWGLSAQGTLGDWAAYPSATTGYLDVLPPAPDLPWPWMSVASMDAIEAAYLEVGPTDAFFGGLASYRVADINWHIGKQYAAGNVSVPALFIAGEADPVIASLDDALLQRMRHRVTDLRATTIVPNAGHFVQLERAEATNTVILDFLSTLQ